MLLHGTKTEIWYLRHLLFYMKKKKCCLIPQKQGKTGGELCQAQLKLGLAKPALPSQP